MPERRPAGFVCFLSGLTTTQLLFQYFCGYPSSSTCHGVCSFIDGCQCAACFYLSSAKLGTADVLLDMLWEFWSILASAANLPAVADAEFAVVINFRF
jgi:hypothetical protein